MRAALTVDAAFDEPQEEVAGAHACGENVNARRTTGHTTFAPLLHGSLASVPRTIRDTTFWNDCGDNNPFSASDTASTKCREGGGIYLCRKK